MSTTIQDLPVKFTRIDSNFFEVTIGGVDSTLRVQEIDLESGDCVLLTDDNEPLAEFDGTTRGLVAALVDLISDGVTTAFKAAA